MVAEIRACTAEDFEQILGATALKTDTRAGANSFPGTCWAQSGRS